MNKKKVYIILVFAFCLFFIPACSDANNRSKVTETSTTWNNEDSLITGETKQLTEPPAAWEVSEATKLKSEKIEYDPKTDGNWRMAGAQGCETENGNIYQIGNGGKNANGQDGLYGRYLYCYNVKSHAYRIMCNRPECYHINEDCDAFLAEEAFGLEYYNGKIYTVLIERDNRYKDGSEEGFSSTTYASLYAINPDGTGKKRIQILKAVEKKKDIYNVSQISIAFVIHRGYVYYTHNLGHPLEREDYYRNGKNCIFRVPLGGSEADAECIYVLPEMRYEEYLLDQEISMIPYGSYVYFAEEKSNTVGYSLGRIDTVNKRVEKIRLEKASAIDFYVTEEGIYYNNAEMDGKLRLHHLGDGTEEIVADQATLSDYAPLGFLYDSVCWYAFFDKEQEKFVTDIIVLDSEFKKIGKLDFGVHLLMFVDAEYNLVLFDDDDKLYGWLDKADIAKGDLTVHRAEQTE